MPSGTPTAHAPAAVNTPSRRLFQSRGALRSAVIRLAYADQLIRPSMVTLAINIATSGRTPQTTNNPKAAASVTWLARIEPPLVSGPLFQVRLKFLHLSRDIGVFDLHRLQILNPRYEGGSLYSAVKWDLRRVGKRELPLCLLRQQIVNQPFVDHHDGVDGVRDDEAAPGIGPLVGENNVNGLALFNPAKSVIAVDKTK